MDDIESHRKMADMVQSALQSEAMDNESESDHFMSQGTNSIPQEGREFMNTLANGKSVEEDSELEIDKSSYEDIQQPYLNPKSLMSDNQYMFNAQSHSKDASHKSKTVLGIKEMNSYEESLNSSSTSIKKKLLDNSNEDFVVGQQASYESFNEKNKHLK